MIGLEPDSELPLPDILPKPKPGAKKKPIVEPVACCIRYTRGTVPARLNELPPLLPKLCEKPRLPFTRTLSAVFEDPVMVSRSHIAEFTSPPSITSLLQPLHDGWMKPSVPATIAFSPKFVM